MIDDETLLNPCRLCLQPCKLCRSHIVPEFLYQILYDDSHRYIEVTNVRKGKARQPQKGHREYLLCSACEGKINRFEKHARRLFVDDLPPLIPRSKRIRQHARIEYIPAKLFFLSVLWRASASSLPIFKHVALGPHEERIRTMLETGDAGGVLDYPVAVYSLFMDGEHFRDFMVEPTFMRVEGRLCYRLVLMGFVVLIYVDKVPISGAYARMAMTPNRPFETYQTDLREFKFLAKVWDTACQTKTNLDLG
jgi:hypothetical protein